MIKLRTYRKSDGAPGILLGLTRANVDRLTAGDPIKVDLEEVGLTGSVSIMFGETQQGLVAQLVEFDVMPRAALDAVPPDHAGL